MRIVPIPPHEFGAGHALSPWLASIADRSGRRLTITDIRDGIWRGRYWLAAVMDGDAPQAALLAAPIHWPGGLVELEIIGLAGAGRIAWQDMEADLRTLAKSLGFERIRALARPGWWRVMKRRGWYSRHVELECNL